jgi:hypothetical protein
MTKKDLEAQALDMYDASDVTWEIKETKRADKVHIILSTEGRFNLIKTYLGLKLLVEKIETQIGVMEETEGEH